MTIVEHFFPAHDLLGEGPLWDYRRQQLFWVDIDEKRIHRLDPETGQHQAYPTPVKIGAIGLRRAGGFILATQLGFAFWQPNSAEIQFSLDPEPDRPDSRFNDGAVDRGGRFWAGTLGAEENFLYRFDPDHSVQTLERGLKIPNGIAWSPDDRWMYLTDSLRRTIYRYAFDRQTGAITNRVAWIISSEESGVPDGLTVDQAGNVWSARWDGWCVDVYASNGKRIDQIALPVPRPTSIMFGGADFRTVFITSARGELDDATLAKAPLAGDVFTLNAEVPGLPEPLFEG